MRPLPTHTLASITLLLLLPPIVGCERARADAPGGKPQQARSAPAARVRLLDRLSEAEFLGLPEPAGPVEVSTVELDFDSLPERIWFARARGRRARYEELAEGVAIDPAGGVSGGALRIGPGVAQDRSRAVFVLPVSGKARVSVRGRARVENNPEGSRATAKEILRVVEHSETLEDPSRAARFGNRRQTHRVSRRSDPSGWDRFETSFFTLPTTRSLEVQLLHRSGRSEQATTRFDDLVIEVASLSSFDVYEHLRASHRPRRKGGEDGAPWRLRVELSSSRGGGRELRDAVLLPPPARLSIPLHVPLEASAPVLRFHYGLAPEGGAIGEGVRIEVAFEDSGGDVFALGSAPLVPARGRPPRKWSEARLDLREVAGREGRLVFASRWIAADASDALAGVLLATPRIEPEQHAPGSFNVLLIGVDTLRADRMSVFGYEQPTTPNLERLAEEGIRFPQARAQAPWTLPSFSSILTSLYPSSHGAGRGGHDEWTPIDPTTTSLAEVLARVGYLTQGIVANGLISPHYGLDQGFEAYRWSWTMESATGDSGSVAAFVESHRSSPWLLFWHIMDPHLPYQTSDELRRRFTEADYDGRFARGRRPYVPFEVLDPRPGRRWFTHEGPPPPPDLSASDRRFVHDYYAAEIAETDAAIGRVLDALRASGQWERTIVALIADHGEGLGDHDHYHHGYTLFDDQVHVPMLLRIPGRDEGRVVERPVATIDLAPMILGALGLTPPEFFEGVDRLAQDAPTDDAYFIECPTYDSSAQKAWVLGDFKYVHDPVFHTEALYHRSRDPGERVNVAAEFPEVVARARAEMDAFRWEQLQKGRFHLRVRGAVGQRLEVRITTDDLFDANFASRPQRPEEHFEMDLDRKNLRLDTELERERLELVFWCRGGRLEVSLKLDGKPLSDGLGLGSDEELLKLPASLTIDGLPVLESSEVGWPGPAQAILWLETGAGQVLPVVHTPEEIEMLNQLGYAR